MADVRFVHVQHEQQRLRREELEPAQALEVVGRQGQRAQRSPVLERRPAFDEHLVLPLQLGRRRLRQVLLQPFEPALGDAQVRENELVLHGTGIARRVEAAVRVRDGLVAKEPHDVEQRVGVAEGRDVEQGPGARLRRARHVGELDGRRHALPRVEHPRQPVETRVGYS
jgi:hypothetical protein